MIGGTNKCEICGKPIQYAYPVHPNCINDMKVKRMLTAEDIKPFEFPSFKELSAQARRDNL